MALRILVAEDDPDDCLFLGEAFAAARAGNWVAFVADGEELLEYLTATGRHGDRADAPPPDLVLLDLNLPRVDGREVLAIMRADARLRGIPVVVLTTSRSPDDIASSYALGANSYVVKPKTDDEFARMVRCLVEYWDGVATLPERPPGRRWSHR